MMEVKIKQANIRNNSRIALEKSNIISDLSHLNIYMIQPLGYLDFITLESFSKRIITDSGGIQKEAYILKKPCITLRTETEWIETVEEKWNLLINPSKQTFFEEITSFEVPEYQANIFGEDVSNKMVSIINKINR